MLIIDRLFIRPSAYNLETLSKNSQLNSPAFLAWAIGAIFAILADRAVLPTPTGIGAMDALILSGLLYFIFAKVFARKLAA